MLGVLVLEYRVLKGILLISIWYLKRKEDCAVESYLLASNGAP